MGRIVGVYLAQSSIIKRLDSLGVDIVELENPDLAIKMLPEERNGFTVHFDGDKNDLMPGACLFLLLKERNNDKIVAGIAFRLDTSRSSLLDFLKMHWPRLYRGKGGARVAIPDQGGWVSKIGGRMAYVGGLWVAEEWRQKGLARDLIAFGQFAVLQEWQPDWIYCWLTRKDLFNGNAVRWGFTIMQSSGVLCAVYPERWPDGLALCASPAEDVRLFAAEYTRAFEIVQATSEQ